MAVGESTFPDIKSIPGIRLGTASAGIKTPGRQDILLIEVAEGGSVAGVFTRNAFCAAPVTLARQHLNSGNIRYLVVNSGNANACTGEQGLADAMASCEAVAELAGISAKQVLPFSTGVIGEPLPMTKFLSVIPNAYDALSEGAWSQAAQAIMTTDTRPKGALRQIDVDGQTLWVGGIAKGAGMIRPNMATMLAYIGTNAKIAPELLQQMSLEAANQSFNRITIDGDTSTNDACMLMASGQTQVTEIASSESPLYQKLLAAVVEVHQELAQGIVRDGEGATKFVTVAVEGARASDEALKVAYAVAHSPLIKTALYAGDPNWGRIVAAIGYADVDDLDASQVKVWLDDVLIVENGGRAATYQEALGQKVMSQDEILIRIHLERGDAEERVWTTDFSYDYIKINAEYRT